MGSYFSTSVQNMAGTINIYYPEGLSVLCLHGNINKLKEE